MFIEDQLTLIMFLSWLAFGMGYSVCSAYFVAVNTLKMINLDA